MHCWIVVSWPNTVLSKQTLAFQLQVFSSKWWANCHFWMNGYLNFVWSWRWNFSISCQSLSVGLNSRKLWLESCVMWPARHSCLLFRFIKKKREKEAGARKERESARWPHTGIVFFFCQRHSKVKVTRVTLHYKKWIIQNVPEVLHASSYHCMWHLKRNGSVISGLEMWDQ